MLDRRIVSSVIRFIVAVVSQKAWILMHESWCEAELVVFGINVDDASGFHAWEMG